MANTLNAVFFLSLSFPLFSLSHSHTLFACILLVVCVRVFVSGKTHLGEKASDFPKENLNAYALEIMQAKFKGNSPLQVIIFHEHDTQQMLPDQ